MGPSVGVVNMVSVQPPQRKDSMLQYARDKLEQLQTKFDELEAIGVQNPSLLVKIEVVASALSPPLLMWVNTVSLNLP